MRYKKSLIPNELNSVYHPMQEFSITLPRKKLDLSTFTLYYKGNPAVSEHILAFDFTGVSKYFATSTVITAATETTPAVIQYAVDTTNNRITLTNHGLGPVNSLIDVDYDAQGGDVIQPLVDAERYLLKVVDDNTVTVHRKLVASTYSSIPLSLTSQGTGTQRFMVLDRAFKTIPRFFPRLSSCVLSDVVVSVENKVIQHIREFNTLQAILNDIHKEYDDIDSTTIDSLKNIDLNNTGLLKMSSKILPYTRPATMLSKYSSQNIQQYFVSSWLGFLGEGSRYFDATDKEVKIAFKLSPPNILYKGSPDEYYVTQQYSATDTRLYMFTTDYEIYDIKATIDVLDDIPVIDRFVFKDYYFQEGSYLASNKKCLTSISTDKPIEWLLSTFKQPDYLTSDTELQLMHCNPNIAKFGEILKKQLTLDDINLRKPNYLAYSYEISKLQKDPYVLNSSLWFSHQGDGIRFCKYRLNGFDLTPQMDIITCYSETKKCFNSDFKKAVSIQSFEADFFANAVRIDDNTHEYKLIEWEVEIDSLKSNTKGGQPMMFCCYTNQL